MQSILTRPRLGRAGIVQLPVNEIDPNPNQPRKLFDDSQLAELSASIAEYGVISPLTVRLHFGRYELVAGERRLRAARMAGLKKVPCIVLDVNMEESSMLAMVENLQRQDLNPMEEAEGYQTALLLHCAREYHKYDWAMQLHFSCVRNPNTKMLEALGPDTGFDSMAVTDSCAATYRLLDALERENRLPKTILYSLNPADNAWLDTLLGAFQGPEVPGKIQHGAAWWFNDHRAGMTEHLTSLANLGLLGNFVGMLTDSRSFLSYARHEYFRRVLCALLGRRAPSQATSIPWAAWSLPSST